ncbi:MAG: hypothetical protein SF162_13255 [bacterium]|nr:hypothetical protein [bacterium]
MHPDHPRSFSPLLLVMLALALAVTVGCSSLPGLQVLTGEDGGTTASDRAVQSLSLVMADKSSATDPEYIEAASRIEAANPYVDVIEVRPVVNQNNQSVFLVNMIYRAPQTDDSPEGRAAADAIRRTFELAWQGTMRESAETQMLAVTLYSPAEIMTLDNGVSYVGIVSATGTIDRSIASSYLQGIRSLETFFDLIVSGEFAYSSPQDLQLYEGTPNHPLFMIPAIQTGNRAP